MKIYMDVCCLCRPFDNPNQDRIHLEAEAVLAILAKCDKREWRLAVSGVVYAEMLKTQDPDKLRNELKLLGKADEVIMLNDLAQQMANDFQRCGVGVFDSLHLALAETGGADVFLTTDDALLRIASTLGLRVKVKNPLKWFMEAGNG